MHKFRFGFDIRFNLIKNKLKILEPIISLQIL